MSPSRTHISSATHNQEPDGSLERQTGILITMTLASRILGLLRIRILSSLLGASIYGDLLFFTLNIPNNFRKLLAEGALSSAFIPEYSKRHHQEHHTSGRFFVIVFAFLSACSLLLLLFFLIFGELLLTAISDFPGGEVTRTGAVLLIIFSLYTAGILATTLISGTLHVHRSFFLPSLAPVILSLSVIIVSTMLFSSLGVYAVAWGFALGAVIPLIFLFPKVLRFFKPPLLPTDTSGFFRRWAILAALSSALFIDQQVSFYLASTLEEGSVIHFSNAIIIWQMPFGVFFASIITALYPKISKANAEGSEVKVQQSMGTAMVYICMLLIPSSLFLYLYSSEISSLILLSGKYGVESTEVTAGLLRWFAPGLVMVGITQLFLRELYIKEAWSIASTRTILFAVLDIFLSVVLIRTSLGVYGLAAACTISYLILAIISLVHSRTDRTSRYTCLKIIGINAVLLLALVILKSITGQHDGSWIYRAVMLAFPALGGMVFLTAAYRLIGLDMITLFRKNQPSR